MGNPSLPSLKHKRHSQVGAGPLWVGKGKRFSGQLLCVFFGRPGRKGTGCSITKSFPIKELNLLFFVIIGRGPNCL